MPHLDILKEFNFKYLYELNTLPITCTNVNIVIRTHGIIRDLSLDEVNKLNNTAACPTSNANANITDIQELLVKPKNDTACQKLENATIR